MFRFLRKIRRVSARRERERGEKSGFAGFELKRALSNKQGTALLTALMVMGVLVAISLALSSLIFRETRIVGELIDAGRAYYAAESGIEEALYHLNNELPGWHEPGEKEVGELSNFEYEVKNTCDSYPCFDEEEYDLAGVHPHVLYDKLELNENITIPLFVVEDGKVRAVKDFTVEFFAVFDPAEALTIKNLSGWDVLRWKVYGMKNMDGRFVTDSISDFTAISVVKNHDTGEKLSANAASPSWFGSRACDGRDGITCIPYKINDYASMSGRICGEPSKVARDYYEYIDGEVNVVHDCYPIADFMTSHQPGVTAQGLNYLSLTNMMNPAVFDRDYLYRKGLNSEEASVIYFRVETYDDDVVREVAEIVSDGYSGGSKQSIAVNIRQGSYMPVFNFAIYSTY